MKSTVTQIRHRFDTDVLPLLVALNKGTIMTYIPGLKGVIATETNLSSVNGEIGELIIAGYPLEEIAPHATFEEMAYLLWHHSLPSHTQLESFSEALKTHRTLPDATNILLREAAHKNVSVIDALRMATATLSLISDGDDASDAQTLIATLPTIITTYWRLINKQEPIAPNPNLNHAANYLYMLTGKDPNAAQTRAITTYLNTITDHGMNASTFTARVITSTRSDLISAIVGAIGALKGPLHGGAPGPVLQMLQEIQSSENAEPYIRTKLEKGERLMGFGHAIYKVRDPRANVLYGALESLFADNSDRDFYTFAQHVEKIAIQLLEEFKPGRRLQTNVEFYTALLLHSLDLHADLFTPTFAIGRAVGWIAHSLEQRALDRIIRPESVYTGIKNNQWLSMQDREVAKAG